MLYGVNILLIRIVVIFSVFFSFIVTANNALELQPELTEYKNFSVDVFVDDANQLTIAQVMLQPTWQRENNHLSFGYSASSYWLMFTIDNPLPDEKVMNLLFTESFLSHVDLYQYQQEKWVKNSNGANVAIEKRSIQHPFPAFPIKLPANSETTFVINIKGDFGLFGSLLLFDDKALYSHFSNKDAIHVFMFGAVSIIALYNLFLWLSLRDKIYLYYVGYAIAYLGWLSIYSGYILKIIPLSLFNAINIALPLAFVFLILFTQELLTTKKVFPYLDKLLTVMVACFAFTVVIIPFYTRVGFQIQNAMAVIALPLLLFVGIKGIFANVINAKIYTLALLLYYVGLMILGLMALGLLPYNDITRFAPFPGSMLELVLFSFALAIRINSHKQQAINAQLKLLQLEKNINKQLEIKVKERTHELNEQKKQLKILSLTDSLTNIYNRRAFRDIFESSITSLAKDENISLIMIDIDEFKNYNDTYGHQKGDEVLIKVAEALALLAKAFNGNAFRIGGEEFALLFVHNKSFDICTLAEDCREKIFALQIVHKGCSHQVITASIGVAASCNMRKYTMPQMYRYADEALYLAKDSGRNQVICSAA